MIMMTKMMMIMIINYNYFDDYFDNNYIVIIIIVFSKNNLAFLGMVWILQKLYKIETQTIPQSSLLTNLMLLKKPSTCMTTLIWFCRDIPMVVSSFLCIFQFIYGIRFSEDFTEWRTLGFMCRLGLSIGAFQ